MGKHYQLSYHFSQIMPINKHLHIAIVAAFLFVTHTKSQNAIIYRIKKTERGLYATALNHAYKFCIGFVQNFSGWKYILIKSWDMTNLSFIELICQQGVLKSTYIILAIGTNLCQIYGITPIWGMQSVVTKLCTSAWIFKLLNLLCVFLKIFPLLYYYLSKLCYLQNSC